MVLSLSHETAWKAACVKHGLEPLKMPSTWPVLISFDETEGEPITNIAVISADQAAKFLAGCSAARVSQINAVTRQAISTLLNVNSGIKMPVPLQPAKLGQMTAVQSSNGSVITLAGLPGGYKVGQVVEMNGEQYVITSTGINGQAVTQDPITGEEGIVEYVEDEVYADMDKENIPGLSEIPMDPGKIHDAKSKIAELGDPTEHVLDVERAV